VEVERPPATDLGVTLGPGGSNNSQLFITHIKPASIAERYF